MSPHYRETTEDLLENSKLSPGAYEKLRNDIKTAEMVSNGILAFPY